MTQQIDYARPTTDMGGQRERQLATALAVAAAGCAALGVFGQAFGPASVDGDAAFVSALMALAAVALIAAAGVGLRWRTWAAAAVSGPLAWAAGSGLVVVMALEDQVAWAAVAAAGLAGVSGLLLAGAAGSGLAARAGPGRLGWVRLPIAVAALAGGGVLLGLSLWQPPPPPAYSMADWARDYAADPVAELPFIRRGLEARELGRAMAAELGRPEIGDELGEALYWAYGAGGFGYHERDPRQWLRATPEEWRAEIFGPSLRLREARAAGETLPGEAETAARDAELQDGGFDEFDWRGPAHPNRPPRARHDWPIFAELPAEAMERLHAEPASWADFRDDDGSITLPMGEPEDPTIRVGPDGAVTASNTQSTPQVDQAGNVTEVFEVYGAEFAEGRWWRRSEGQDAQGPNLPATVVAERLLATDALIRQSGGPGLRGELARQDMWLWSNPSDEVVAAAPDAHATLRLSFADGRTVWVAPESVYLGEVPTTNVNGLPLTWSRWETQFDSPAAAEAARVVGHYLSASTMLPASPWPFGVLAGLGLVAVVASRWPLAWLGPACLLPPATAWAAAVVLEAWRDNAAGVAEEVAFAGAAFALAAAYAVVPGWRAAVAGRRSVMLRA